MNFTKTKKIFGEDHACMVTNYRNLALVYNRLGVYNQAKEQERKSIDDQEKDHVYVERIRSKLA